MKNKRRKRQYHPAVCAGLHIALEEYSHYLSFEEEHKLGTGSKSVDCLILKKDKEIEIKKDIGRIFRGHNLIEIKGYGDYLSIDKFYQTFGYALFYKVDTEREGSIDIQDITLTFITSSGLPRKVTRHLEKFWGIEVTKEACGIYYYESFAFIVGMAIRPGLRCQKSKDVSLLGRFSYSYADCYCIRVG